MAVGIFGDPAFLYYAPWMLVPCGIATFAATVRRRYRWASVTGHLALAALSVVVSGSAHSLALHPPLRTMLEQRLGGFSIDDRIAVGSVAPITIEGRLREDAALSEAGATLALDIERIWLGVCPEPVTGGVLLTVSGNLASGFVQEWRAGRVLRLPASLRRPARYLNDGVPDQERLLAQRGISLVGGTKSAALVEIVAKGRWIDEAASHARGIVRAAVSRHIASREPQSGAIATAILIGDRAALDPTVEQRLQEAGTYHVIAISGGNIAIVAGVALAALWWIGVRGSWAAAFTILLLGCYGFVAGGSASVVRATTMAVIYLSLRLIDQRTAPAHAMALTAAFVLLVTPLAIVDVGFWLTFGATVAIVAGVARMPLPSPWTRVPLALVLASLSAEAAVMPIGALVFQRVTIAGPLLNLAAVPCMGLVQLMGMLTVAADLVGLEHVASAAGWVTHTAARVLVRSAALVDFAPWVTWRVVAPSLVAVTAYYASLIVWWRVSRGLLDTYRRQILRRVSIVSGVALFLWIAIAPPTLAREHGDGRLHLTVMDVGHGDAMLIRFPKGRRLMVDTGGVSVRGAFDIGDRVLGPGLRARGVTHLDYLAVTHGDPDHIGGARSLVRAFAPAEVWEGVPVANHDATRWLHEAAGTARASWRSLQRGDRFAIGDVEIRVHHPALPDWERQKVRNDDSLVLELRIGRVSVLLTGDIGHEVETSLIPQLDLLPLVVLKSPHHGSGTSSSAAFLNAITPDVVLISCGRGNPYGHPVPYVLARYRDVGAEIFRTDHEGQIEVVTDGESLRVETFTGRHMSMR
ncbi:MAG: DNA internalization-related competence protein ComEC/Rec2 [Vicinamibacterales bacterium]